MKSLSPTLNAGLNSAVPSETICCSEEETIALGRKLAQALDTGALVCLHGDLGAGKTTFIKGIAAEASQVAPEEIHSPTFTYLHIYKGRQTVYHFDLYRLKNEEDFLAMGFDEFFFAGGICCVEWSERISKILPESCIKVECSHEGQHKRKIVIRPTTG